MSSFGGTSGVFCFNDVWEYQTRSAAWAKLDCQGPLPTPREGHAAAVLDDVMYVFGGRDEIGHDLGDLTCFDIRERRWYVIRSLGNSPSARSGHSMTSDWGNISIVGGKPSNSNPETQGELTMMYILQIIPPLPPPRYIPSEFGSESDVKVLYPYRLKDMAEVDEFHMIDQ